jgi:excisionase family DNA binding protein
MPEKTDPIDALAYTTAQAAAVTGRSHTRIKKAIREGELTARKDGRATLIERTELARWIASLPTKGRKPEQEPAHVAASLPLVGPVPVVGVGSARGRHRRAPARSTPPPRSLESTPR